MFGIGPAVDLPNGLSGRLVDGEDIGGVVGLHPMEHLQVQPVAMEQRRGRVAVIEPEASVVVLNVTPPKLIAFEIETGQKTRPGQHPDVLAVGDRRWRGQVLLAVQAVARAGFTLPQDGTVFTVDRQQQQLVSLAGFLRPRAAAGTVAPEIVEALFGRRDQNHVTPDNRRRRAPTGQANLPLHVFGCTPTHG